MNESRNAVISALIQAFGEKTVLSRERDYCLTQKDLKIIFGILNEHLFGRAIKYLPVVLWPMRKLVDKVNYHVKMSGDQNENIESTKCLGVHTAICTEIYGNNGEIIDIRIRDQYLIINSSEVKNDIFIFDVAVICHEMIHAYDQQTSNEIHDMVLEWEKFKRQEPRYHDTKIFMDKMQEANDNGVNVVSRLSSDETHDIDNKNARYVLKKVIGENENSDTEILKGEQTLYFRNKKTGCGYLVHFD